MRAAKIATLIIGAGVLGAVGVVLALGSAMKRRPGVRPTIIVNGHATPADFEREVFPRLRAV